MVGALLRPHLCLEVLVATSLGCRAGPAKKAAFGGWASTCTIPFSILDRLSSGGACWVPGQLLPIDQGSFDPRAMDPPPSVAC